jgi:Mn-containing catalase
MFKRIDSLLIELPMPSHPDPNGASAVQELLGGKFGEMSTLNNYLYQSFNFRGKSKLRPFYDLVASITAEEVGHVELVANTINLMLTGTTRPGDPDSTPLGSAKDLRMSIHFIDSAQTALLVRGGVHILAYAKALEIITGVDVTKILPVPRLDNKAFDAARPWEERGEHRRLYTFSDNDYQQIARIWRGTHPIDGGPLEAYAGVPGYSGPIPDLGELPEEFAPGVSAEDLQRIANWLSKQAGM